MSRIESEFNGIERQNAINAGIDKQIQELFKTPIAELGFGFENEASRLVTKIKGNFYQISNLKKNTRRTFLSAMLLTLFYLVSLITGMTFDIIIPIFVISSDIVLIGTSVYFNVKSKKLLEKNREYYNTIATIRQNESQAYQQEQIRQNEERIVKAYQASDGIRLGVFGLTSNEKYGDIYRFCADGETIYTYDSTEQIDDVLSQRKKPDSQFATLKVEQVDQLSILRVMKVKPKNGLPSNDELGTNRQNDIKSQNTNTR